MVKDSLTPECIQNYQEAAPLLLKPDLAAQVHSGAKTVTTRLMKNPLYRVGQCLYVRENWRVEGMNKPNGSDLPIGTMLFFAADELPHVRKAHKWRPSLFMPKWAARSIVRVVSVEEVRLQDLSDDDLMREGFSGSLADVRRQWQDFWSQSYGAHVWTDNVPCRVYRFERNAHMIAQWQSAASVLSSVS